ncbi:MAG: hypothetical protein KJ579_05535 [Verrucomicrobia bacterium]|nr:hypothetical protein [Verrucomicrobiota bacterium]
MINKTNLQWPRWSYLLPFCAAGLIAVVTIRYLNPAMLNINAPGDAQVIKAFGISAAIVSLVSLAAFLLSTCAGPLRSYRVIAYTNVVTSLLFAAYGVFCAVVLCVELS